MNDDFKDPMTLAADPDAPTLGMSSVYRLFEAFIGLREKNERQHKLFEQTLNRARDALQASFNTFAAETQKAYQQMRQEMVGEKRFSLTLLNELLDLAVELEHIVSARPAVAAGAESEVVERWMKAIEIQSRKVQESIRKFGIHPYDAVVGAPYNPALHERVGSKKLEGMDALRVAEQVQRVYASQQPEFILR